MSGGKGNAMFDYINRYYGLSVFRGQHVKAYGKNGQVIGVSGPHLKIRLEGQKSVGCYHPTDGIVYADFNGIFPAEARDG